MIFHVGFEGPGTFLSVAALEGGGSLLSSGPRATSPSQLSPGVGLVGVCGAGWEQARGWVLGAAAPGEVGLPHDPSSFSHPSLHWPRPPPMFPRRDIPCAKEADFGVTHIWVPIPARPLTGCVALGQRDLSEPRRECDASSGPRRAAAPGHTGRPGRRRPGAPGQRPAGQAGPAVDRAPGRRLPTDRWRPRRGPWRRAGETKRGQTPSRPQHERGASLSHPAPKGEGGPDREVVGR